MPDLLKKMSEFQRQHPVAAISRAFGLIKGNMITILVFLYVGSQSESFSFWIWLGGGAAFLLTAGFLNWWRFLFKIEDDTRSEEHTSELQSRGHLVCRLLLQKKTHTNR